jgi:hypothetical protein
MGRPMSSTRAIAASFPRMTMERREPALPGT